MNRRTSSKLLAGQILKDCLNFYLYATTHLLDCLLFHIPVTKHAQYLHTCKRNDSGAGNAISNLSQRMMSCVNQQTW